jgi:hypothetical protein
MYGLKSPYAPQVEQSKQARQQQAGMGMMRSMGGSFGNGMASGMEFGQAYKDKQAAEAANAAKARSAAAPAASAAKPGMMSAMKSMPMMGMSDERSKKEIQRLESANDALTQALSSKAEYPDTGAPSPGMQALGQQTPPPSHASFADAPADKVAAQNVGLQQATPPAAPPPVAQGNRNPAFNVSRGTPDLSALDEAYARMGRGG